MPPADRIREHNEQDPGRVAHTRQEAGSNDFLGSSFIDRAVAGKVMRSVGSVRPSVSTLAFEPPDL